MTPDACHVLTAAWPQMVRAAARVCPALAEDAAAEAVARVLAHGLADVDQPEAYLCRAARHAAIDLLRRRRHEYPAPETEQGWGPSPEPSPERRVIARDRLGRAMLALTARQRQAVLTTGGDGAMREARRRARVTLHRAEASGI